MKRRRLVVGVLSILCILLLPAAALAGPHVSQIGGNAVNIPLGHSVETVVAIGTDAHINGRVSDIVLVINGNAYLDESAHADLVVVMGGHVFNAAAKTAHTDIFEVHFTQTVINELFIAGSLFFSVWLFRAMLSLFCIILLTGLGYALRQHFEPALNLLSGSASRLFGIGAVATLISVALIIFLALTIVGIPLAVLIILLLLLSSLWGLLPIIAYLGNHFLSAHMQDYPDLTRWLVFAALFVALANLPLLGIMFVFGTVATGLGLTLTQAWIVLQHRRSNVK
ncbi:MAG: hypothetical protein M0Z55_12905 [Peptococcaceae bacterium]|nr:hypothetical protein [Peptococcaceae bacterium]